MAFADDMGRFVAKVKARDRLLRERVVEHVRRSIVDGSEVTGAPGQPVDTGRLKKSFRVKRRAQAVEISSDVIYAPIIEDNLRGATLRSKVGGFHSIAMTRIGFRRIVRYELSKLPPGAGAGLSGNRTGGAVFTVGD